MMKVAVDILIIGSGLAGMSLALRLPKGLRLALVDRRAPAHDSASWQAQGGIAAAIANNDSLEKHWQDTASAGAGLSEPKSALALLGEAPAVIDWLLALGVPFSRYPDGQLAFGQEGGHVQRRILHVEDRTGFFISEILEKALKKQSNLQRLYGEVIALMGEPQQNCQGAWLLEENGELRAIFAKVVVLATGGLSALYQQTTVPHPLIGKGLWLAAQHGATLADLEFVQFHPTALQVKSGRAPLLSEALRGEGAWVVDAQGRRFMDHYHPLAELAPRDIVARAIQAKAAQEGQVFLSLRHLNADFIYQRFPGITALCQHYGLDLAKDLLPVLPAAHYSCGGIRAQADGETTIEGLFAIGECACTGLHGANRLASNSLLECVAMAFLLAKRLSHAQSHQQNFATPLPRHKAPAPSPLTAEAYGQLRSILQNQAGVFRHNQGLAQALAFLKQQNAKDSAVAISQALVTAALAREESRGCHYRADFPEAASKAAHSLLQFGKDSWTLAWLEQGQW